MALLKMEICSNNLQSFSPCKEYFLTKHNEEQMTQSGYLSKEKQKDFSLTSVTLRRAITTIKSNQILKHVLLAMS